MAIEEKDLLEMKMELERKIYETELKGRDVAEKAGEKAMKTLALIISIISILTFISIAMKIRQIPGDVIEKVGAKHAKETIAASEKEVVAMKEEIEDMVGSIKNKNSFLFNKIYTGYIAADGWGSKKISGLTKGKIGKDGDGWEKLWEGKINVPSDAVGAKGKALIAVSLSGHSLSHHCYFSIFLNDKSLNEHIDLISTNPDDIVRDLVGASLMYPAFGGVTPFWANTTYSNFTIIEAGEHLLSVAVNNPQNNPQYSCQLNGARINYAIIPAFDVVEADPVVVHQIK